MKRLMMIAALLFIMVAPMFAYDGFKFNDDGVAYGVSLHYGIGYVNNDTFLLKEYNIDESKLVEVVVDRDAYCLLYWLSFSKDGSIEYDWCVVESADFVGVKRYNGYWTEYHLYKKVGGK